MLRFRGSDALPGVLDQHLLPRVGERTLELYKREGNAFAEWTCSVYLDPGGPEEWNDAMVEY